MIRAKVPIYQKQKSGIWGLFYFDITKSVFLDTLYHKIISRRRGEQKNADEGDVFYERICCIRRYMGYVNGKYMLFADEEDYRDYIED